MVDFSVSADPILKANKTYKGELLSTVLSKFPVPDNPEKTLVVFTDNIGEKTIMNYNNAIKNVAYIVSMNLNELQNVTYKEKKDRGVAILLQLVEAAPRGHPSPSKQHGTARNHATV